LGNSVFGKFLVGTIGCRHVSGGKPWCSVGFWLGNLVFGKFLGGNKLVFGTFLVGKFGFRQVVGGNKLVFGTFLVGKFDLPHVSGWKTWILLEFWWVNLVFGTFLV
jgi:hypothetical protein